MANELELRNVIEPSKENHELSLENAIDLVFQSLSNITYLAENKNSSITQLFANAAGVANTILKECLLPLSETITKNENKEQDQFFCSVWSSFAECLLDCSNFSNVEVFSQKITKLISIVDQFARACGTRGPSGKVAELMLTEAIKTFNKINELQLSTQEGIFSLIYNLSELSSRVRKELIAKIPLYNFKFGNNNCPPCSDTCKFVKTTDNQKIKLTNPHDCEITDIEVSSPVGGPILHFHFWYIRCKYDAEIVHQMTYSCFKNWYDRITCLNQCCWSVWKWTSKHKDFEPKDRMSPVGMVPPIHKVTHSGSIKLNEFPDHYEEIVTGNTEPPKDAEKIHLF
jgi:hypothetical protein